MMTSHLNKFGIAFFIMLGLVLPSTAQDTPTPEPTPENCFRLDYESTFNITSPNLHLLYEYNLETGSEPQAFAFSTTFSLTPNWTTDGTKVAFIGRVDGVYGLYTIDFSGDRVMNLIYEGDAEYPAWSPDGSQIAFLAGYATNNGNTDVYVINADGSDLQRLTDTPEFDFNPIWSPDGKAILHSVSTEDSTGLVLTTLSGSDKALDLQPLTLADEAQYSPDGTRLLFRGVVSVNDDSQLFIMDIVTNEVTQLTQKGNNRKGRWSPDGTQIVYTNYGFDGSSISLMDTDGTNQKVLTDGSFKDNSPAWSADGSMIAFTRLDGDPYGVYVIDLATGEQRFIASGSSPVWRPCDLVPFSLFPPGG